MDLRPRLTSMEDTQMLDIFLGINKLERERHGMWHSPEHNVWKGMIQRCYKPDNSSYADYGGRGITVCDRWRYSFKTFLADMGRRPGRGYEIDREDVNGNYEPGNCRWVTKKNNCRNMRSNRIVQFQGRSMTLVELAETTGNDYDVLQYRIAAGWPVESAVSLPVGSSFNKVGRPRVHPVRPKRRRGRQATVLVTFQGRQMPLAEASKLSGIEVNVLRGRIKRGWDLTEVFNRPIDERFSRIKKPILGK